jgi:hypothetical protein
MARNPFVGLMRATVSSLAILSGQVAMGETGTSDRFMLVMDGAAVKDNKTGLIWEREPDTFHGVWSDANPHCLEKTVGGRTGWRAPTVEELASLVDQSRYDPALPAGHPFSNVKSAVYWTATSSAKDPITAWHVSFLSGEVKTDQKSQTRRVWCVRASAEGGS